MSSPARALFVTCWYPHAGNSGFGTFVREHALAARAAGIEVHVLAVLLLTGTDLYRVTRRDFDDSGLSVTQVEIHTRAQAVLYNLPALVHRLVAGVMNGVAAAFRPTIIHAHVVHPAGYLARKLSQRLGVPYLVTEHWSGAAASLRHPVRGAATRQTYERAAAVTPVSHYLASQLGEALSTIKPRLSVLYNVVSDQFTYQVKPESAAGINLLMAMALTPPKQPLLVLQALALLPTDLQQRCRLTIVGDGILREQVAASAKSLALSVTLAGRQPKSALAQLQNQAHLFLHASTFETFGVVVAEALTSGTPVLVSNVGALPEQVQPAWGRSVANTPQAWADAITQLLRQTLANQWDYAAIAAAHQGRYDQRAIGQALVALYQQHSH